MVHFPLLNQALRHPSELRDVQPLLSEVDEAVQGIRDHSLSPEAIRELQLLPENSAWTQLKEKNQVIGVALSQLQGPDLELYAHPAWHGASERAQESNLNQALQDGYDLAKKERSLYELAYDTHPEIIYALRPCSSKMSSKTTTYATLQCFDGTKSKKTIIQFESQSGQWSVYRSSSSYSSLTLLLKSVLGEHTKQVGIEPPQNDAEQDKFRSGKSYVTEKHLYFSPISSRYGSR